jgi:hypothetical protein
MFIHIFFEYKNKKNLAIRDLFMYIVKKFINPIIGGIVYEAVF